MPPKPPHPPRPPLQDPHSPPHQVPHSKLEVKSLLIAFFSGSVFSAIIYLILSNVQISINVILPVLAPIWVGSVTLVYLVLSKK